ncbi:MAG TPA: FtsX-like permease family protein [Thermoanaerobaculia bacterium]|nr:FtsX-like permease family protein [Thermoanaerobaculia bacterium]
MPRLLLSPLPFAAVLALRYLKSTRKDAFASFLSAVAAGGIALGVAALILSLAVISGFQDALRSEILGRTPQLEVELPPGADAAAARRAVLAVPGVRAAQVQARGGGWVVAEGKVQPVELVGIEGTVPRSFPGAAGRPEGLYVPRGLAERWALRRGQLLRLASPRPTLTPFGPQPRVRTLPVAGFYESGRTQQERERVALPLRAAESLVGGGSRLLEVTAGGLDEALTLAARLPAVLPPGAEVRTWQDLNRPLLFALRLEKAVLFVAVFLIVLVAALALVADLALVTSSKRPEIGMLGAMGATAGEVGGAFLLLGALVGGLGTAAGAVLGVAGAWVLDRYELLPVPGRVYFLDYVPFLVRWQDLVVVLALTLFLALVSSYYTARRAAAMDPIEAMRR